MNVVAFPTSQAAAPPPASIDAEQAILGAILVGRSSFARVQDILRADDFFEEIHRRTFDVAARLAEEGKTPTLVTVMPYLGDHELADGLTTRKYLTQLCMHHGGGQSIQDNARVVRELSLRRQIMDLASQSIDMAAAVGFDVKPDKIAAQMVARLDEIAAFGQSDSLKRIGLGAAATAAYTDALEKRSGKPARGVKTGLKALDEMLGALEPGHGSVLAGRPSAGKTAVGLGIAHNVARAGAGVAYISLEMGGVSLAQRALANETFDDMGRRPIPYVRIARGQFSDAEAERIDDAVRRLARVPMQIEQQPGLMVSQITARVRQIKAQMAADGVDLALVVIDHLGLVGASSRYSGDRVREIGEISAGLHGLARETDTHVMMLCQLNRKVEERQDKRPQLSDLRESGEIEQNADVVMGVFRESYYLERSGNAADAERAEHIKNELELNVLKNRQGPTGSAKLFADMACNAIRGMHP